jgi:hypothetical protein
MEHSSHGCPERVVVRVERCRVVGAAPWSEFLGGSEKRFNCLVSENNQGGYRLEASGLRSVTYSGWYPSSTQRPFFIARSIFLVLEMSLEGSALTTTRSA